MDITLHKIGRRDRKIHISKLVREPGKIGQTAWQNQSDMTKIISATDCVNGAYEISTPESILLRHLAQLELLRGIAVPVVRTKPAVHVFKLF
jgi:hypothetical protein